MEPCAKCYILSCGTQYIRYHVGPRPSFEETLVVFDHFWDFDRLVEDGAPRRSGDRAGSHPFLRDFWAFRVYVMGMGCHPMGLPMSRPFL
jgi:hypothetical protein